MHLKKLDPNSVYLTESWFAWCVVASCLSCVILTFAPFSRTVCTQPAGPPRYLCDGRHRRQPFTRSSPSSRTFGPLAFFSTRWCRAGKCPTKVSCNIWIFNTHFQLIWRIMWYCDLSKKTKERTPPPAKLRNILNSWFLYTFITSTPQEPQSRFVS